MDGESIEYRTKYPKIRPFGPLCAIVRPEMTSKRGWCHGQDQGNGGHGLCGLPVIPGRSIKFMDNNGFIFQELTNKWIIQLAFIFVKC